MEIRRLDVGELDACVRLATSRHWHPERHKWGLLFQVGEVYGIDDPAGGLAGVVVLTRFGTEVTGVGMMLVAERYERRGLGTRLMTHVLAEARTASVWLTATDMGRPLYEKLGFRVIGRCTAYVGRFEPRPDRVSRLVSTEDIPALVGLDTAVFGASRADVLTRLPAFADEVRVVDGPDGPVGYGACWSNTGMSVVGPVVAADEDMARSLIADLAGNVAGNVRLDLDHSRPELLDWVLENGFEQRFSTAVMIHGDELPGDRKRLFTPVTVAMG
jgi:GNAT superfamily N-acetyltransferase